MQVTVRELGLAAYLRVSGCRFLGYVDDHFVFESERDRENWEVEYLNSLCYRHDSEIMTLRKLMKRRDI